MSQPKIKKAFASIVAILEANLTATVEEVLPQVIAEASAKVGAGGGKASTFHKNEDGEVVAIQCYYHKLWMDPRIAEFGAKASSPTGFNSMCKDGANKWSAQQRAAKNAEKDLLQRVADGEVAVGDIPAEQEAIAAAKDEIVPREDGYGFETLEECLADSEARG